MAQYSVLIVDDDVKLVMLLQTYFVKEGYITYTANDGLDALQVVWERKPDIMDAARPRRFGGLLENSEE
ncbi:MAG: two component transcriptional regulator, winged helix family [Firmicutes bacterium]|nr:two component transcriptional regulator, winged helix family [Bacillota bacterium]